ncbi:MAG: SPOR domain-containing protein, partial [Spirochaetia bacterium]|nr:SPOR domain-containing protein [Spirochaetia bacterium]
VRPAATPLSKDDEEAVFEDIKDKVVAFIAADDVDQAAARYVSADTVGKSLPKPAGTFYVQLGFFSSLDNAEQIAYTVQTSYPVLIVSKEMSTYVGYRVLAGPVPLEAKEDVLGDFRDAGFPDAFASF